MAVDRIVELCGHKEIYPEILLQVHFIMENCPRLVTSLTSLEATHDPLACTVYGKMEDMRAYLVAGTTNTSFGPESDRQFAKLKGQEKTRVMKSLHGVYKKSLDKLVKHFDDHPAKASYKAARMFDPRQLPALSSVLILAAIFRIRIKILLMAKYIYIYRKLSWWLVHRT